MDYGAIQSRMFGEFFYQSDSHAAALRELGHEAATYVPDCLPLQLRWAREKGLWMPPYRKRSPRWLDGAARAATGCPYRDAWNVRVLAAQMRDFRPDAVAVFSGVRMTGPSIRRLRRRPGKWICHWASPIVESYPYGSYDLVVTTARNFVEEFGRRGCACRLVQHAFDERIAERVDPSAPDRDVVFVGSISPLHRRRTELLEELAGRISLDVYGEGFDALPEGSRLRACWKGGAAFGLAMYRLVARYRIALHVPGEAGAADAGAKRIFETAGAGALLLAERQPGLDRYFEIGKEIEVFSDGAEAAAKIRRHLADEGVRAAMAAAGRRRVLRDHVYRVRMKEWIDVVGTA